MKNKIILDLCGGTGSWAAPWNNAKYNVITITLPHYNVNQTIINKKTICFPSKTAQPITIEKKDVYGILAAPPCTMFSFARTNAKKPRDLREGMECVRSCLDIIWSIKEIQQETGKKTLPLKFWALENPYHGFLPQFLGKPAFTFDPWEFGDLYKKKTALWGHFNMPIKTFNKKPDISKFDKLPTKEIHSEFYGKYDRTTRRAITPRGFAEAFFKSNQYYAK